MRRYDPISAQHTSQWSKDEQERLIRQHEELSKPRDDPMLVKLLADYKGELLLDFDDNIVPNRTYEVLDPTLSSLLAESYSRVCPSA